jgi:pimeloyl-ACP methyl ester carboxylesterase
MSLKPAYADPAQMTEERVTRYHELLRAPGVRAGLIDRMRQVVLRDPVPLLQTIDAPTLLIWGDRDAMVPVANAQDYLKAFPRARLVTLPGVGHLPQEEATDAALAALQAFLAE